MTEQASRPPGSAELERALRRSGLTFHEIWLLQFSVGGDCSTMETEAYVLGVLPVDRVQYNFLAVAFNEHFMQVRDDYRVPFNVPDTAGGDISFGASSFPGPERDDGEPGHDDDGP